ncbi:hypothetical protein DFH28DRAFT_838660, partial [Melampsora americana]
MTSSTKKSKEARRVTCCCQSQKCHLGRYVDAHGIIQSGVEVIPSTLEAHRLADIRLAYSRSDQTTPSTEDLIRPLAQLGFNSTPERPVTPVQHVQRPDSPVHTQDNNVIPPEPSSVSSTQHHTSPNTSTSQSIRRTYAHGNVEEDTTSRVCLAANSAYTNGVTVYQCERFYTFSLEDVNPLLLYVALIAAMLSIFARLSMSTASWLLDNLRVSLELCLTQGLNPLQKPKSLLESDAITLRQIPKSITTVIRWLKIDPRLIEMNCCDACFALYPLDGTPTHCNYRVTNIPGGP